MKANVPIHYIILDTIQKNLPKSPIIIILIHIFHSIGIIIPTQNILRLENSKFTVYKYTYNLLLFHLLEKHILLPNFYSFIHLLYKNYYFKKYYSF